MNMLARPRLLTVLLRPDTAVQLLPSRTARLERMEQPGRNPDGVVERDIMLLPAGKLSAGRVPYWARFERLWWSGILAPCELFCG